jgi:hypothetical protein
VSRLPQVAAATSFASVGFSTNLADETRYTSEFRHIGCDQRRSASQGLGGDIAPHGQRPSATEIARLRYSAAKSGGCTTARSGRASAAATICPPIRRTSRAALAAPSPRRAWCCVVRGKLLAHAAELHQQVLPELGEMMGFATLNPSYQRVGGLPAIRPLRALETPGPRRAGLQAGGAADLADDASALRRLAAFHSSGIPALRRPAK